MNDEQQPACGGRPSCHRHEGAHSVDVDLDEVVEVEDERPVDMGKGGDLILEQGEGGAIERSDQRQSFDACSAVAEDGEVDVGL